MAKKTLLFLTLLACSFSGIAQRDTVKNVQSNRSSNISIGLEAGTRIYDYTIKEYDVIRPTQSYSYYDYNDQHSLQLDNFTAFASIKLEYHKRTSNFWFATGINYSIHNIALSKYTNYSDRTSYFYVSLNEKNDELHYYRVNRITETDQYIGVPLELRYSPFEQRVFRAYFKAGFDNYVKVSTERTVDFESAEMEHKQAAILDLFEQSDQYYAEASIGLGFQIGWPGRFRFRAEADAPSYIIPHNAFAFMNDAYGCSIKLGVLLPIN